MTQGDPLDMITYSIDILPLINNHKRGIPDVTKNWYADDSKALGTFARIETYVNFLTRQSFGPGYYTKLSKSVLIVHPENIEAGKVFGACHSFKVCIGASYLRGYTGDNRYKSNCLREFMMKWKKKHWDNQENRGKYPQGSYGAVAHTIQPEYIFL